MSYERAAEVSGKVAVVTGSGTAIAGGVEIAKRPEVQEAASRGFEWLGFNLNEWALIVGIATAILTTAFSVGLSWYYKQKHLELARQRINWPDPEGGE